MLFMSNKLKTIESAQAMREWSKKNLPFYESVVCYDLIIYISIQHLKGNDISVKHIFDALPHSYTAIRQHYLRLIKDGWIEVTNGSSDRRVKHIKPTKKFEEIISEYARVLIANPPPLTI